MQDWSTISCLRHPVMILEFLAAKLWNNFILLGLALLDLEETLKSSFIEFHLLKGFRLKIRIGGFLNWDLRFNFLPSVIERFNLITKIHFTKTSSAVCQWFSLYCALGCKLDILSPKFSRCGLLSFLLIFTFWIHLDSEFYWDFSVRFLVQGLELLTQIIKLLGW